jgi:hypothetical protein
MVHLADLFGTDSLAGNASACPEDSEHTTINNGSSKMETFMLAFL